MPEHEMKRRYGPLGRYKPKKLQCIREVYGEAVWNGHPVVSGHQCTRKRGHGPKKAYCRQHAKRWEG